MHTPSLICHFKYCVWGVCVASDEFFPSFFPQGTIFLPGNKVTEHPTNGDEGGKFLFEVVPGRKGQKIFLLLSISSLSSFEEQVPFLLLFD